MTKFLFSLLLATVLPAAAQEMKKFEIKADDWAEGEPPAEVFVVDGKISIAAKDGNKAIKIDPGTELVDASAQLGTSAAGSASIQARVFASKQGRSTPRFGVSVHGLSGYRLIVNPAKKQLELHKGDQIVISAPLAWTTDTWMTLKLDVTKSGETWSITGSAWADAQPAEPMLKHEDKGLKGQGKCAVWATPYSGTPVYFDDISIAIEAPVAAP